MTGPRQYRKRPVVIEAMQWTGDNAEQIAAWTGHPGFVRVDDPECTAELWVQANSTYLPIVTGEWIAKDSAGFYPIKPAIFEQTYEPVEGS